MRQSIRKITISVFLRRMLLAIIPLLLLSILAGQIIIAKAATALTITPITWNIVGLDSNDVTAGPENFPVGARVCNTGTDPATGVVADFVWDDGLNDFTGNANINLRSGSLSYIDIGDLAAGACYDAYFEVTVTRDPSSYDKKRSYHITADSNQTDLISTPTPREIYVEHLVSQSRNSVINISVSPDGSSYANIPNGGTMTLVVGNTYWIKLDDTTATNGYEQIESFINFPNTIFQVLSVVTTYSVESSATMEPPYEELYGDGCTWENNPNSPNYRSCLGTGKAGGTISVTYEVKILAVPAINPEPLTSLVYDFSGSSYHYNQDLGITTRYANILGPSAITIDKSFVPNTIARSGSSTLTIHISNPTDSPISGINFIDPLPTNVIVASSPNISNTGCGSPNISATAGASSISFSYGTIAANSICTIKVDVTSSTVGAYTNTTNHLFINGTTPGTGTDTGNDASAILNVKDSVLPSPPSTCANPAQLALWDFSAGTIAVTNKASDVATATASYTTVSGTNAVNAAVGNLTYGWGGTAPTPPNGWAETPTSMANYFQFVLDTHNYGGAYVIFDANPYNGGDWANPYSNVYVNTSADGGAFTVYSPYPQAGKGTWTTLTAYAASTGTGTTTFRFGADGSGKKQDATFYLDNVKFMGCRRPDPPTITKSFSPDPVAVGNTSTLTFNITNPNTDAGALLSGISFSDYLPYENLQGTVTTDGTATVIGTGTAFTTQLIPGSIVYIPTTLVDLTGTVAVTQGSQIVAGTGTTFSTELAAGSIIYIGSVNYTVSAIASDTSLTLSQPFQGSTTSGLTASSNYKSTYVVSSITSDTELTLTTNATPASDMTMGAGLTLTVAPSTTCSMSTVRSAAGGTAISLSGNKLTGTVTVSNGSPTVTGSGTSFMSELAVGSNVFINSVRYQVSAIPSATSLTLSTNYAGAGASGLSMATDGTNLTGTVGVTNGSASVTGTGTSFTAQLAVGDVVTIASVRYGVATITSDTSLTLNKNYAGTTATGLTMIRNIGLAGGASCTVTATVKANVAGTLTNVSGIITAIESGDNTTSNGYAKDDLTAILPPVISKFFNPNPIPTGGISTLTFIIQNPNPNNSLSGVAFIDTFPTSPAAMTVASPLRTVNDCGGSLLDNTGDTLGTGDPGIQLTGGIVAAGRTCTVQVNVTAATAGSYTNTSGYVSHIINTSTVNGNMASDILTVNAANPEISLLKQVGLTNNIDGSWYSSRNIAAGTSIYYKFTVENTGDVDFTSFNVTDPILAGTLADPASCSWNKIDPTDLTPPFSYLPTTTLPAASASADPIAYCVVGPVSASAGGLTNTATAHGNTGSPPIIDSDPDTATYLNGNFGHLPSAYLYANLYNDGGAMHLNGDGTGDTYLGTSYTSTDSDGINTPTYTPKSTDNGVSMTSGVTWSVTSGGSVDVTVVCLSNPCYLNAWFDWNKNNDFNDTGESVFINQTVTDGLNTLTFSIPADTMLAGSRIYSRFRISPQPMTDPSPYGLALNITTPLEGEIEDPYFEFPPTAAVLSTFEAVSRPNYIQVLWETATEQGLIGFNIYRADSPTGERTPVNPELIVRQSMDDFIGAGYALTDSNVVPGQTYYYWIEYLGSSSDTVGPILVVAKSGIFLPIVVK